MPLEDVALEDESGVGRRRDPLAVGQEFLFLLSHLFAAQGKEGGLNGLYLVLDFLCSPVTIRLTSRIRLTTLRRAIW